MVGLKFRVRVKTLNLAVSSLEYLGFKLVIFVVNCEYSFQSGVFKDFGMIEPVKYCILVASPEYHTSKIFVNG